MKIKKVLLIGLITFSIILFALSINVNAASISISASSTTVSPGESVTITVTGNDATGRVNVSASSGSVSPSSAWLENNSQSFTATAPGSGSMTITASGEFADSDANDFEDSKSVTISVSTPSEPASSSEPTPERAAPSKSSNANLRNLVVQPVDFTGFRASKTSGYSVTVDNDVTEVKIIPTLADSNASYSISGNTNLKEGTNVVKVTVTAEDGTQKTYQVNVIRKVAGEEITPNTSDESDENANTSTTIGLSKLEVKGLILSPEFAVDTYKYTVILEDEKQYTLEEIKELIIAEVNFEGGTFEIQGDEILDKEENSVVVSVKDSDGREIAVYTILFKYNIIEKTSDTTNIEVPQNLSRNFYLNKNQLIVLTTILFLSFVAIISSINSYRFKRKIKIMKSEKTTDEDTYQEYESANDEQEETLYGNISKEEETKIEEEEEIKEDKIKKDEVEEEQNANYISDLFQNRQMEFEADDSDFMKKKPRNKKGKHSN